MTHILTCVPKRRDIMSIEISSPLARALASVYGKPHGISGLKHRFLKFLFYHWHQDLHRPAWATMRLANGRSFQVDCANTSYIELAQRLAFAGGYEPEVSLLLDRLSPALGRVFDIGANCGLLTMTMATAPGFRGKIDSFEIHPKTQIDLKRGIEGGGLTGIVTCHDFGLSDGDGEVRLSLETHSFLARVLSEQDKAPSLSARVRRLDGLGLAPPDLIKIDVEGHEAAALRGGGGLIEQSHPYIIFESWYGPARPDAMLEPLRLLDSWGYGFYRVEASTDRLTLTPMGIAKRSQFPEALNLFAAHPARKGELEALFATAS